MSLTARDVRTPAGVYALDEVETDFGGRVRDLTITATVWGDFRPGAPGVETPSDGQPFVSQTADFICRSAEGLSVGGWLNALFSPRADKLLFAATKADQVHHSGHDRLEAILKRMTDAAIARAGDAGAEVDVIALAAVRATREALVRGEGGGLPSIVGVAAPGTGPEGRSFDGLAEVAVFPGDLPADVSALFDDAGAPLAGGIPEGDFRSIRFRPPALEKTEDGVPALPHIRLDRALQFLIGDRLR